MRGDSTYIEQVVRNPDQCRALRQGRGAGIEIHAEQVDGSVAVRVPDRGGGSAGSRRTSCRFSTAHRPRGRSRRCRHRPVRVASPHQIEAMGGRIQALIAPDGGAELSFSAGYRDRERHLGRELGQDGVLDLVCQRLDLSHSGSPIRSSHRRRTRAELPGTSPSPLPRWCSMFSLATLNFAPHFSLLTGGHSTPLEDHVHNVMLLVTLEGCGRAPWGCAFNAG